MNESALILSAFENRLTAGLHTMQTIAVEQRYSDRQLKSTETRATPATQCARRAFTRIRLEEDARTTTSIFIIVVCFFVL